MSADPEALLAQLQDATQHAEALKKLKASHLGPAMPWKARQVREGWWVVGNWSMTHRHIPPRDLKRKNKARTRLSTQRELGTTLPHLPHLAPPTHTSVRFDPGDLPGAPPPAPLLPR